MLDLFYKDIDKFIDYGYSKFNGPLSMDFHLHEKFEIYFFISGSVNYFIEKKVYPLKYGSLLVMNSHEIHKPSLQPGIPYERITIHFDPSFARFISSPDLDLLTCFTSRPRGEKNLISLSRNQAEEVHALLLKIEKSSKDSGKTGWRILKLLYFAELLVYINRAFIASQTADFNSDTPLKLVPVLDYIDENLEGDLSLEALERKFFINRFHLGRMFKKTVGSSIHEYVIIKRIAKAKKLLSEGKSVTETTSACGFNDYSNFLRMFKKTVGMSPGQYRKRRVL